MQVTTVSFEHEYFAEVIGRLVDRLSMILRIKIIFFGRATLKRQKKLKGSEPDACFYVQSAVVIGNRCQNQDQYETLLAFEDWLRAQP
jgi:hypothetical protein